MKTIFLKLKYKNIIKEKRSTSKIIDINLLKIIKYKIQKIIKDAKIPL